MSSTFANPDDLLLKDQVARGIDVEKTAFYLESQGESLFAWLHRRPNKSCHSHGVVVCPPIGVEQLHSHRAIRHLADAVAEHNIPVVRIDYHGTGDSPGSDEDPQRLATWIANVRDTVTWMRDTLGCQRVSVIGLRMGATLAAMAATEQKIENLILWAPVMKGSRYFRELKAISLMVEGKAQIDNDTSGTIKAAGFVMTKETADSIHKIDLLRSSPRCRQALVVHRDDVADDTRLRDHFSAQGIAAAQFTQPGYVEMMAEPHYTRVPRIAIDNIAAWLSAKVAEESMSDSELSFPAAKPALGTEPVEQRNLRRIMAEQQATRERLCQISENPDLFGILCEPDHQINERLPLIVLLSSGTTHRIGPGRLYVQLARRLCAEGFRTLRMDFSGLGDSVLPNSERENDPYTVTAFRDVDIALKFAQQQCGAERVVLMGLCSGAYAAFQSAAQLANPVLVESVLINPLTYFWKDGMSLDHTQNGRLNAMHYYLNAVLDPKKWLRLLSGNSQLGIIGGVKMLVRRLLALSHVRTNDDSRKQSLAIQT